MALSFALFASSLLVSVVYGISIMVPLLFGLVLFAGEAIRRGHSAFAVIKMVLRGAKKSAPVMIILLLIGVLTAMWHAGGTIPICVYYGLRLIEPRFFVLSSFILSCCFAYAIGSSFGTVGTIGIVIMALARSGGVEPHIAAGAVLSGAFFGDRSAPVSSSASLVATLTETLLYSNVRNMLKTAVVPIILSVAVYLFLSFGNPMQGGSEEALSELASLFELKPVMVLPAVLILLLPPFGVGVKKAMSVSIVTGALLAVFARDAKLAELLRAAVTGCEPVSDGRFAEILSGGGMLSMMKAVGTVFVASSYAGIFEGTGMLDGVKKFTERLSRRVPIYHATMAASLVSVLLVCNQTLAIILTSQIMNSIYDQRGVSREVLAIDMEDTVTLIAGLVPWSIAVAIPLVLMETDASSILYAVFLWILPLVNAIPAIRRRVV